MTNRYLLVVGSFPAGDATEAMTEILRAAGHCLRYLPDGETGDRDRWVVGIINSFRRHPGLEVRREGDWSSYDRQLNYRVRRGYAFTGTDLDLGLYRAFADSMPVFRGLRAAAGRPDLTFQVGVPGDFDLALFTLGLPGALRYRKAFTTALAREVTRIHAEAGDDVLFQLELPAELVLVARTPPPLRGVVAARLARSLAATVGRMPRGARFGVHLCVGDLGHKALTAPRNSSPLVHLANAVAAAWPAGRPLEYVHAPLAAGDRPPPVDAAFYRPLSRLRLPGTTRFVAGFLHEGRSTEEAGEILAHVEANVSGPVDVAAACGLGRRGRPAAMHTIQQGVALIAGPDHSPAAPEAP